MELKYKDALHIGDQSALVIIRVDELKAVKEAFVSNYARIGGLAYFPVFIGCIAADFNRATIMANHLVTKKHFPTPDESRPHQQRIAEEASKFLAHINAKDSTKAQAMDAMEINISIFAQEVAGEAGVEGAHDVFRSMVVQAWTAFEVMAGDLWEAALNAHPRILSDLNGNGKKWTPKSVGSAAADASGDGRGDEQGPAVPIRQLQRLGYDLSKSMGSALRDKYAFTVLSAIRIAYGDAFSKGYQAIRDLLCDKSLDYLAAVRNIIVHKAGKADQEFLRNVSSFKPFADVKFGEPIKLDGAIVKELLAPAFKQANDLISAVDDWIWKSPKRPGAETPPDVQPPAEDAPPS